MRKIEKIIQTKGILLTGYECVSHEIQEKLGKQYHMLPKQAILQDYEGKRIIEKLHEVGMRCVGLKGLELRRLYPEITMRQMTDIDLMIAPYDFASIREFFSSLHFSSYACKGATQHDTLKNTVSIEAYKRITESADSEILAWEKGICDCVLPTEDGTPKISNEDLCFYYMIHMRCDFRNDKLDLRCIADTWILQNMEMNWKQVDSPLEKLELSTFNERMAHLSRACSALAASLWMISVSIYYAMRVNMEYMAPKKAIAPRGSL